MFPEISSLYILEGAWRVHTCIVLFTRELKRMSTPGFEYLSDFLLFCAIDPTFPKAHFIYIPKNTAVAMPCCLFQVTPPEVAGFTCCFPNNKHATMKAPYSIECATIAFINLGILKLIKSILKK